MQLKLIYEYTDETTVIGYAGCVVMFIIATGLIAKFSVNSSKTYAAAAVAFLFLYVFLYVFLILSASYFTCKDEHTESLFT
jgi:hypothetical protein